MDLAAAKNDRNWFLRNYHEIWMPGPEVLFDRKLADRLVSARPVSSENGPPECTIVPFGAQQTDGGMCPKIRTMHSSNDVSCSSIIDLRIKHLQIFESNSSL